MSRSPATAPRRACRSPSRRSTSEYRTIRTRPVLGGSLECWRRGRRMTRARARGRECRSACRRRNSARWEPARRCFPAPPHRRLPATSSPDPRDPTRACRSGYRSPCRSTATRCATSSRCGDRVRPATGLRWRVASAPAASFHLGKRPLESLTTVFDFRLADQHRGRDPQDVAVESAFADQQALLLCRFQQGARLLG